MDHVHPKQSPIAELERVVLIEDLSQHGLKAGDVGTVVHVYSDGQAYEIEFFSLNGATIGVVTVEADQVRRVEATDVAHARKMVG